MADFVAGNEVRLKSSGPPMTVQRIVGARSNAQQSMADEGRGWADGFVVCQWFENDVLREGAFPADSLDLDE